jgi:hypothetical protein
LYEMGGKRSGYKIKSTIKCKSPTLSSAFAFYYNQGQLHHSGYYCFTRLNFEK